MLTARRLSVYSSGNCSAWLASYGIPVAAGEAGWGKWEEGGSGNGHIIIGSMFKIKLGHFGAEVGIGGASGSGDDNLQ